MPIDQDPAESLVAPSFAELSAEAAELGAIADADLTDDQLDRLEALPGLITAARTSDARAAAELALAAPAEAPAEDVVEEPVLEGVLVASAPAPRGPAPVASAPRRVVSAADAPVPTDTRAPLFAAADVSGHAAGAQLDMLDVARAIVRKATSLKGRPSITNNYGIAQIVKPFDSRAIVSGNDPEAAFAFATDESNLPGGSLVAAGGWCAPSEVLYDLCELETVSGIISLPEVMAARGGFNTTIGPNFADLYGASGFCFTEAQDAAGNYSLTNEVQSITEGGAGLTSYTLTYSGQTTAPITEPSTAATVQAALIALSNLAPGDVVVTGGGQPFVYQVTFGGTLAGTDVTQMTATPTGGTGTVTVATVTNGGQAGGSKPCYNVECPEFVDTRLGVCGVCITAGYLQNRAYPELTARVVRGALVAHEHRVAAAVIANIVAGSDAVTFTSIQTSPGAAAPLLDAIELQATAMRYSNRMAPEASLEVILPVWARGAIRADLSRRLGVDLLSVSDGEMDSWATDRHIAWQFVYNFQDLTGSAASHVLWPTTVSFIMYPAGAWIKATSAVIDLGVIHSPDLYAFNQMSALFTEEGWNTIKRCNASIVATVPICASGATAMGAELVCQTTAP